VSIASTILPPAPVPYREGLFTRLAERGRVVPRVVYLSGGQPGWDQPAEWFSAGGDYPSESLRSRQRRRAGRTPVMVPRGLGGALARSAPECVVSWEYSPATLRALLWCRRRGVPLVVFSELTPDSDAELSDVQLRVHRAIAPRVDGFIVASSRGVERLERMRVDPRRVEVALQAADVERFERVAAERGRRDGGPVRIVCVARLVPDKNVGALIDALRGLEGVELVVAGTGPLEDDLRRRAAGLPVRFAGFVGPERLPELYAEADAVALVSTYEPFGVTMREGAAAGLPLICTRAAGAAGDVAVEDENALLVDPRDADSIAAAVRRIATEPDLRDRLAAGSRAVTARHPLEADVEAWERAILGAVERQRGG
jgi:glycosyltransferase involved in cell wall biosynthesis